MADTTPKQIIEALIMASEEPLGIEKLHRILEAGDNSLEIKQLRDLIGELVEEYDNSGIELKEVASGWRFQIKSDLSEWVGKLYEQKPPRYSRALLEILALIAYRQPITRAEIENVRGVAVSSNIMKTLLEHEWVKVVGYKEVPGRPALFATTKRFLDHFNLKNLNELPPLMEFTEELISEAESEVSVATGESEGEGEDEDIEKQPNDLDIDESDEADNICIAIGDE